LKYFLAVAREESITRAAEQLHMSQPPLSRQLKDLEDELGKQLLIRGSRRVRLTEEGQILRRRAEEIINLVDKAEAEIMAASEEISGWICVGATA
jgi:DNA-binding transcriptional LysR family regulator